MSRPKNASADLGQAPTTRKKPFYLRWWFWLVVVVVVIVVIATSSHSGGAGNPSSSAPTTAAETQASSPSIPPTSNATNTAADFGVTIDSTSQVTDDTGNPALMVTFTFTNNSNTTLSFMDTGFAAGTDPIFVSASQGTTVLNSAAINGDDTNAANSQKEISPGGSVQIHWAYELVDTSDVTVTATIAINGNDLVLDTKTVAVH